MDVRKKLAGLVLKAAQTLSPNGSISNNLRFEIGPNDSGVSLVGLRISTDSLFTIWRNNSDVFACVRELANNTGSQGYMWVNTNDENKDPNPKSVQLAEQAIGRSLNFSKLKGRLVRDVQVAGNAYLLKQTKGNTVVGFAPIDPRTLSVVTDKYGTILRWVQQVGPNSQTYQPDEVLQWKLIDDPNSPVFGVSPLEPVVFEVRTDLAAMVSNYAFFQNDAQPGAIYMLEEGITEENVASVVNQIKGELRGSENRHKSTILAGVKEIKTIGINQKDMEFHVLRRFTTEKVCSVFGVPKSILNYTEDVNLANGQEQTKKFWEGTIDPLQKELEEFINKQILPAIGLTDIRLEFNERSFDNKEFNENSNRLDLAMGVLTVNEVRELRGYAPYDPSKEGEYVEKPVMYSGTAAVPFEELATGADMSQVDGDTNLDAAAKFLSGLEKRYTYARPQPKAKD